MESSVFSSILIHGPLWFINGWMVENDPLQVLSENSLKRTNFVAVAWTKNQQSNCEDASLMTILIHIYYIFIFFVFCFLNLWMPIYLRYQPSNMMPLFTIKTNIIRAPGMFQLELDLTPETWHPIRSQMVALHRCWDKGVWNQQLWERNACFALVSDSKALVWVHSPAIAKYMLVGYLIVIPEDLLFFSIWSIFANDAVGILSVYQPFLVWKVKLATARPQGFPDPWLPGPHRTCISLGPSRQPLWTPMAMGQE